MANLKMQTGSQWWYGRYKLHGKDTLVALGIKIEGKRPARLKDVGDQAFETSRIKAQLKIDKFQEDLKSRKSQEKLAKEIYRIQSGGEELPEYKLTDLFDLWCGMKERSEGRKNTVKPQIEKFIRFMRKNYPGIVFTYQVNKIQAKAYMDSEADRGVAPGTYNDALKLMKSCFRETESRVFDKIVPMKGKQIHRVPYTEKELERIRKEAESDPFIRPVIIFAMCTGMRLGDCCNLKWADIDEDEGIVRVKTNKTDTQVVVPLFDWLEEELNKHHGTFDSKYVLPRQRWKYMADSNHLTKRLRKILVKSGFGEPKSHYRLKESEVNSKEAETKVQSYLDALPENKKTLRMCRVFSSYISGKSVDRISEDFSISKSTASLYLNELEQEAGVKFIRGKSRKSTEIHGERKPVQVEREHGLFRASIRDFHAFRTTWVTLALKAGVPVETVKLVTGHKTVEIVIENYYNPNQRDIRDALKVAMPFSDSKKEAV